MKEKYVKPRIIVERFTLTQSIAANCGVTGGGTMGNPTSGDAMSCTWEVGSFVFFLENTTVNCLTDVTGDVIFEEYCYNNPNPSTALFNS